jgi:hypothetical protein
VSACAPLVPRLAPGFGFVQVGPVVQGESACKPASVPPGNPGWRPSIWDRRYRRPRAVHQGTRPGQPPRPRRRGRCVPYSTLLRVGFTEPTGHPAAGALLPHRFTLAALTGRAAVCSLWHCPAGRPDWRLASTLPCGGRTFLDPGEPGPRPPSRLPLPGQYATRTGPGGDHGLRQRIRVSVAERMCEYLGMKLAESLALV